MKIHGLQKMTLLDFPGRVACTVFLGGCDFRCPFCHNSGLLDAGAPALMDDTGLLEFLEKRKGVLDGVAFTGGEPLLRAELPELMQKIRDLDYPIKLDTNGNHPEKLKAVVSAGLVEYVAMDIKNSPKRYADTIGFETFDLEKVQENLDFLRSGAVDYELRTTVVDEFHDDDSFRSIAQWIKGAKRYYLQCFTDRESVLQPGLHAPSKEDLQRYAEIVAQYVETVEIRGI